MRARIITVAEARALGVTLDQLAGSKWRRVAPATYARSADATDPLLRLIAASGRLPPTAVFSGLTAVWVHGLDVAAPERLEVTIPPGPGSTVRGWLAVRRAQVDAGEVVRRRGLRVTSLPRTLTDLARVLPLVEVVVLADAALNSRLTTTDQLVAYAAARAGTRGSAARQRVIELCEPLAESPMETRLRLLLQSHGLPRPQAQAGLRDRLFRVIARVDLYYPEQGLVIEFDGGVHREKMVEDNRRQNRLLAAGYHVLRFTGADVLAAPDSVVAQVRQALLSTKPSRPAA